MSFDKSPREMSDAELKKAYEDYYKSGNPYGKSIVFGSAVAEEMKKRGLL